MKCHTNVNSTLPTQLPHKFSYIVAILIHIILNHPIGEKWCCFATNLTPVRERCVQSFLHHFLYGAATINFTFNFYANLDYNHL
jgi:hypothetical protein